MRIVKKRTLVKYWTANKAAEAALRNWLAVATKAHWATPGEIKDYDRAASFVGNNRVIFNIGGRRFRLVVSVAYEFQAMYIKFIGTHAEYDRIDAATVDMDF